MQTWRSGLNPPSISVMVDVFVACGDGALPCEPHLFQLLTRQHPTPRLRDVFLTDYSAPYRVDSAGIESRNCWTLSICARIDVAWRSRNSISSKQLRRRVSWDLQARWTQSPRTPFAWITLDVGTLRPDSSLSVSKTARCAAICWLPTWLPGRKNEAPEVRGSRASIFASIP